MRFPVIVLTVAIVAAASPAHAVIPVTDELGIIQWVAQTAKQAQQYATQMQQYQTQLQQYANMVQNTVALPTQVWNTVQSDLAQVRSLANASALLSGNSGSMLQRLSSVTSYAGQAGSLLNMGAQLGQWQQTISNNVSTMGRVIGMQQAQATSTASAIENAQQNSANATGQMQVLQAGVELASTTSNQLLQIQSTLQSTAQMEGGLATAAADRRALEDAAMLSFTAPTPAYAPGVNW